MIEDKAASYCDCSTARRSTSSLEAALDTGIAPVYVSAMSNSVVSVSPEVMSGAPVFPGTRVPVQTQLEYLEAGDSIDEFLAGVSLCIAVAGDCVSEARDHPGRH